MASKQHKQNLNFQIACKQILKSQHQVNTKIHSFVNTQKNCTNKTKNEPTVSMNLYYC